MFSYAFPGIKTALGRVEWARDMLPVIA